MDNEKSMEQEVWEHEYNRILELGREMWDLGLGLSEKGHFVEYDESDTFLGKAYKGLASQLQELYPDLDLTLYAAYHVLICSSTDYSKSPYIDLPKGEIEKTIKDEIEKLKQLKN